MDNSNPIFVDFFGIYGKFNGTPWINCRQKWNVQGFPENSRPGNLLQFAIEHDHRNSGFSQLEHGGSFHSYVAVYLYQRVSSSLLDFENWVYSLVDPKKFPFCNGRSVGRSRALSLFLPPPLSLSLVPFLRVLFEHHVWFSSVIVWWFTNVYSQKRCFVMSTKEFPHSGCVVEPWLDSSADYAQPRRCFQPSISDELIPSGFCWHLVDIQLISQTGHIK